MRKNNTSINIPQRIDSTKHRILDAILFNYTFPDDYDIETFKKAWMRTKFTLGELESLADKAYFVRNSSGICYIVFITKNKNITNSRDTSFCVVNSEGLMAKKLRFGVDSHIKLTKRQKKRWKIHYDVIDEISLKKTTQSNTVHSNNANALENNRKDTLSTNDNIVVYVFFRLTNACMQNKHTIESVTAKTTNALDGKPINVNVFHCIDCDKYFINYDTLKDYISRKTYPALPYSIANTISGSLNEVSKLMLYGYCVAEGKLSLQERRAILTWVIDSGLLTKSEIIKDLQFKVNYNGSKVGNERAKMKWQDDIRFVSRYVKGNVRTINATFVRK